MADVPPGERQVLGALAREVELLLAAKTLSDRAAEALGLEIVDEDARFGARSARPFVAVHAETESALRRNADVGARLRLELETAAREVVGDGTEARVLHVPARLAVDEH